jgi:hypothetical protein
LKIVKDIREADTDMNKKHPLFIKSEEKVAHTKKKLDGAPNPLNRLERPTKSIDQISENWKTN